MGLPEIKNDNIEQYLNKKDIIKQTVEQIKKDFGMFGIKIKFSGKIDQAYIELHHQLTEQVTTLFGNDYGRLLSVLYQVDISEKEILKTHSELVHYSYPEVIAHQIIVRDLKKVLTRQYFKAKS